MQRKLVKQGSATLMVSLPTKWCKANHLEKGSLVELTEQGKSLQIGTSRFQAKQKTTITYTSNVESAVRSPLVNAYRRGYDEVEINYSAQEQFKIIQELVRTRLLGFEITKHEGSRLIIENITEPSAEQFDNIMRKVFQNISSMIESTKKRLLADKNAEPFEEIEERINKYENFCRRTLAKGHTEEKPEMFIFLTLITHAQRELYHANRLIAKEKKLNSKFVRAIEGISNLFKILERAYFEKSSEALEELHKQDKIFFYGEMYDLLEGCKGKETVIAYHFTASARKFFQANSPLTALIF